MFYHRANRRWKCDMQFCSVSLCEFDLLESKWVRVSAFSKKKFVSMHFSVWTSTTFNHDSHVTSIVRHNTVKINATLQKSNNVISWQNIKELNIWFLSLFLFLLLWISEFYGQELPNCWPVSPPRKLYRPVSSASGLWVGHCCICEWSVWDTISKLL